MAAHKRDGNGNGMSRAVAVLIENMQSQFKAFGERLQGMDERMQGMDERMQAMDGRMQAMDGRMTAGFARVDERLDRVDHRLDRVEHRLDGVDHRLDGIDHRLDGIVFDVGLVKTAVLENSRVLLEHGRMLKDVVRRDEVDSLVERAVARSSR